MFIGIRHEYNTLIVEIVIIKKIIRSTEGKLKLVITFRIMKRVFFIWYYLLTIQY